MNYEVLFDDIKREYKHRGAPFRWDFFDAIETFAELQPYLVEKSVRGRFSIEDFPRDRVFFNNFVVTDPPELVSYLALNLIIKCGEVPDHVHSAMTLGVEKNEWSRSYFCKWTTINS